MPRKRHVHANQGPLSFGEWANLRRLGLGLTQQNLARLVGCSEVWIKKIEHGETPSEQTAEGLANALQIPPHLRSRFFRAALSGQAGELPPPTELHAPPPPKSPPPQPAKFFGRTRELGDIAEHLNDPWCRLLTLRGPGGVGKTRLALYALEQQRARWDAVCFVSLREVASPHLIPQAIADALQLRLTDAEPVQQIAAYLREIFPKTLMLLDNFEHLLDGADLAHELLTHAPEIKILVTSREQLHLDWERIVDLEGLDFPRADETEELEKFTAVELFVERARRAFPRFPVKAELADAAQICRLVEGHPLALELAAAWVASFSCAEIAAQLETNIQALKKERQAAMDAHASITAAFDYSYARLTTPEQETFRRLAFFEGGFERDAADAVTQAPHNVLTALADKSLVQREGRRFDLHELLRRYALEKLNAVEQESAATARRMVQYFLQYAQTRHDWYLELEKEWSNLNAGLRLAHAQQDYATVQAYVETLREPWERRGRYTDARQAYRLACEAAQASGDLRAYANDLCEWGKACVEQGDYDEAERYLESSRALFAEMQDQAGLAKAEFELARVCIERGKYQAADELLCHSKEIREQLGDRLGVAEILYRQARITDAKANYGQAERDARAALAIQEKMREQYGMLRTLRLLSNISLNNGALGWAQEYAGRAQMLAERLGEIGEQALIFLAWGDIYRKRGDLDAAQEHGERGLALLKFLGDRRTQAIALYRLGLIQTSRNDFARALEYCEKSLTLTRELDDRWGMVFLFEHLGVIYAAQGNREMARDVWQQGEVLALTFSPPHPRLEKLQERLADKVW